MHLYIHIFYDFVQSGIRTKYYCGIFLVLLCSSGWVAHEAQQDFISCQQHVVGRFLLHIRLGVSWPMPSATAEGDDDDFILVDDEWWPRLKATKLYPDVETYINNVLFERGTEISQIYTSAWCKPIDIFQSRTRTHQPRSNIISTSKVFKSIPHGLVFRM